MKIGFGRTDITPRVGVKLSGFGPFITRHSVAIRDRLWARATALEHGDRRTILVSSDLIGNQRSMTCRIRKLVMAATGVPAKAAMVHCMHTHSGLNTGGIHRVGRGGRALCRSPAPARRPGLPGGRAKRAGGDTVVCRSALRGDRAESGIRLGCLSTG